MILFADNCFGQNKNKYIISFLGSLLDHFNLNTITYNFLCVGHTHNDADMIFGIVAHQLQNHDILTIDDLKKYINIGDVNIIEEFDNYRLLFDKSKTMKGISKLSSFLFERNREFVDVKCYFEMIGKNEELFQCDEKLSLIPIKLQNIQKVKLKKFDEKIIKQYIKTLKNFPQIQQNDIVLNHYHDVLGKHKPVGFPLDDEMIKVLFHHGISDNEENIYEEN